MRENFNKCCNDLLRLEGVEVSDTDGDRGGLTGYSGITEETFHGFLLRKGLPLIPVFQMTHDQAAEILLEEFWVPGGCDNLVVGLDFIHFAWLVNHGPGANKHLQLAAEAWDNQGLEDGFIGPLTLAKIASWGTEPSNAVILIQERYLAIQAMCYDDIEKHDPIQLKFLKGWKNRIIRTRDIGIYDRPLSV